MEVSGKSHFYLLTPFSGTDPAFSLFIVHILKNPSLIANVLLSAIQHMIFLAPIFALIQTISGDYAEQYL